MDNAQQQQQHQEEGVQQQESTQQQQQQQQLQYEGWCFPLRTSTTTHTTTTKEKGSTPQKILDDAQSLVVRPEMPPSSSSSSSSSASASDVIATTEPAGLSPFFFFFLLTLTLLRHPCLVVSFYAGPLQVVQELSLPPIRVTDGERYAEITEYLKLPQMEAAKRLGIPISTLSKRWKEVVRGGRKWPYRAVRKLDTEIMTLLHNVPDGGTLPKELEQQLAELLAKRNRALQPVVIRI